MNSLYTSGVRQTTSLQVDLERMRSGESSASLLGTLTTVVERSTTTHLVLGQISASLAALHRTVDDYDSMAKREMIKAKQEKALM
jgi:Golgi SNAP receptor complex protein 2